MPRDIIRGSPGHHSKISGTSFEDLPDIIRRSPEHHLKISGTSFEDLTDII
jgi:hypothetical protein